MKQLLIGLSILTLLNTGCTFGNSDSSIVLWYDFSEGQGVVLKDKSGNGNDGQIHGAIFTAVENGYALKFDGEDDYVDCGENDSLNLHKSGSIELLVKCDGDSPFPEYSCIAGKGFGSYMVSHRSNKYLYFNISGGGNSIMLNIPNKEWLHIVATFDGKDLTFYINGKKEGCIGSIEPVIGKGGNFYLGRTSEESRWTGNSRYKGKIALVKVYNCALSENETISNYKKSKSKVFKPALKIRPYIMYSDKQVLLEVDPSGLGELKEDSYAIVELSGNEGTDSIKQKLVLESSGNKIDISYDFKNLAGGNYTITSQAYTPNYKLLGKTVSIDIQWPKKPSWEKCGNKVKIRNNFVSKLLEATPDDLAKNNTFTFVNPREGWVYFEVTPKQDKLKEFVFTLNSSQIITLEPGAPAGKLQSMQLLEKGKYNFQTTAQNTNKVIKRLSVRSMPEIILTERGPVMRSRYPEEIKILLNEVNVTLENFQRHAQQDKLKTEDISSQLDWLKKWRNSGRRSITHCKAPGYDGTGSTGVNIEQSYDFWSTSAGLVYLDGMIIDEFGYGTKESYLYWIDAVKRIKANPANADKNFYGFCTGADWAKARAANNFQFTIRDLGYYFAPEIYLSEQSTKVTAKKFLHNRIRQEMAEWLLEIPNSMDNVIINLGCCSKHSFNMNTWPNVDYRVFYDMQLNILANDPLFFNLRGITAWVMRYADPENLRWMAKLYRHYCIEGKRNLLSEEYGLTYELDHIKNADFEHDLSNWNTQESGKIKTDNINGYGSARDFWKTKHGNSFCIMEKSQDAPNTISQIIRNLEPGKLYSIKLVSSDYGDLVANKPEKKKHGIYISVENAEILNELSIQEVYRGSTSLPPYMPKKRPWFNWHFKVFKANDTTAKLMISDWTDSNKSGETTEQAVMFNFVEVQPYFANR